MGIASAGEGDAPASYAIYKYAEYVRSDTRAEKPGEDSCQLELELDAPCLTGLGSGEAEARETF